MTFTHGKARRATLSLETFSPFLFVASLSHDENLRRFAFLPPKIAVVFSMSQLSLTLRESLSQGSRGIDQDVTGATPDKTGTSEPVEC